MRIFGRDICTLGGHAALLIVFCTASYSLVADEAVPVKMKSRAIPTIDWETTLNRFQFETDKFLGQRLTVKCPPIPRTLNTKQLYGTDI
jgi:hypothetical protein